MGWTSVQVTAATVLLAGCAGLMGCAGSGGEDANPVDAGQELADSSPTVPAEIESPIGSLLRELEPQTSALDELVQGCMRAAQIDTYEYAIPARMADGPATPNARLDLMVQHYLDELTWMRSELGQAGIPAQVAMYGTAGTPGCAEQAATELLRPIRAMDELLGADLAALEVEFAADERVRLAYASWSDCMSGRGFDFDDRADLDAELKRRLDALFGPPDGDSDVGGAERDVAPQELAELRKEIQEVADLEREVFAATADCGIDEDSFFPRSVAGVRADYEEQFLADHADDIDALRAMSMGRPAG